jgi:glycosyltransferase involved in cell wall biosynthesis
MARMRVTLVNRLAGIQTGGGEVYDIALARALLGRGLQVELITGRRLMREPAPPPEGLTVRHVRTPYLRGLAHRMGGPGWRLLDLDLALFERAAFDLLTESAPPPDIAQITGMPRLARRVERQTAMKAVLLFPGPPSVRNRESIENCATVVGVGAVTPYLRENFRLGIHDMTAGVDSTLFRPGGASARARLAIGEEIPVILFAGRLVPLKNISMLVEAFAAIASALPEARLLVAGDGPLRSEMLARASAARIRDRLILAGEIPHAEMPEIYRAADILLLTSLNESFSLVALEAMACGVPVVVPRVGYLPTLVEDGEGGRIYEPGDVGACAESTVKLLRDPAERRRSGEAARRRALTRHSWDTVAGEFEALYRRILGR